MPEPTAANPYRHREPVAPPACEITGRGHSRLDGQHYYRCATHKCTFTATSQPDACPCADAHKDKEKENG